MKIYLAGPLFTSAERQWNAQLARLLEQGGIDVWLPQEKEPHERTARDIFQMDVEGIDQADAVVAIMDGPDPDSGTSWEVGYAYAKEKLILLVRTDFRRAGDAAFAPYNIMLSESADGRRSIPFGTVETTAGIILRWLDANGA